MATQIMYSSILGNQCTSWHVSYMLYDTKDDPWNCATQWPQRAFILEGQMGPKRQKNH